MMVKGSSKDDEDLTSVSVACGAEPSLFKVIDGLREQFGVDQEVEQKNKLNSTIRLRHEDLRLIWSDIVTS